MATNRADTLDPALLRPGRLDRKIEFPLPSRREKRLIFQTVTSKMNLGPDVDLEDCTLRVCLLYSPLILLRRRIKARPIVIRRDCFYCAGCRTARFARLWFFFWLSSWYTIQLSERTDMLFYQWTSRRRGRCVCLVLLTIDFSWGKFTLNPFSSYHSKRSRGPMTLTNSVRSIQFLGI